MSTNRHTYHKTNCLKSEYYKFFPIYTFNVIPIKILGNFFFKNLKSTSKFYLEKYGKHHNNNRQYFIEPSTIIFIIFLCNLYNFVRQILFYVVEIHYFS